MALTDAQKVWIGEFTQQAVMQEDFLYVEAQKQMYLLQLRKEIDKFRSDFRKAFELTVHADGKKIGKLLEVDGTQMDEVDIAEYMASDQKTSPEAKQLANRAGNFIINQTEMLKGIQLERLKSTKSPEKIMVRLFSDQEIADELYTPLVRERMLPETLIGDMYSETQKMINRTNELYLKAVEQKKEAGELTPAMDRGKEILKMGGGLVSAASGFIGEAGDLGLDEDQTELVKNILDGTKMAVDISDNLYDLIKNSDFPNAADSLIDNIGNLLGHVISIVVEDDDLANQIAYGYKAAAKGTKAGIYFATGEPEKALDNLAACIESSVSAGDPKGNVKGLATGAKAAAMGLRNASKGWNIKEDIKQGNTAAVINGLTDAMKSNLADSFALVSTTIQSEEKRDQFDEKSKKKLGEIDQYIDWGGVTLITSVKVYEAAKQKDIAAGMKSILDAVSGQLTSILERAGLDETKAGVIGNSVTAGVQAPQIVACFIQDPPDVKGALTCLGTGIEKAFISAAPGDTNMKNLGALMNHLMLTGGKGVNLSDAFKGDSVDIEAATKAFEEAAKYMGKVAIDFAPPEKEEEEEEDSNRVDFVDKKKDEDEDDPLPEELAGLNFSEVFSESVKQLKELDEEAIKERQLKQQEEEAMQNARGDTSANEMIRLLEESSHGDLSSSDAAKIDTLIAKMVKDRMIMDMALKISQGGMAVAAKFVPALGAAVNAIKLAANIMAAAERAQALHAWKKNTKDFEMAQNMLAAASQNFVRNQAEQFGYYTIQAAFEAAQLVGELLGSTGIGTAAGKALSASAGAAKACQDLIRDYARKEDLESAWRLTCKSFNNPNNRKLALKARSMNPTLAKYCIAWGAYEKKDPLAKNAVRAIGLNESSLEHEKTDCDKVVQYMETYFRDDLSLYREIEMDGDWLPDDISLTLMSWGAIKARAIKNVKLENPDTARIDTLLDRLDRLVALMEVREVEDAAFSIALIAGDTGESSTALVNAETGQRIADVLDELKGEFYKYKPVCTPTGLKVIKSVTKVLSVQSRDVATSLKDNIRKLEEQLAQRELDQVEPQEEELEPVG